MYEQEQEYERMPKKHEDPEKIYLKDGAQYYILFAKIAEDNSIPPLGRLLYGKICALSNKEGYCWAENGYLSKTFEVGKGQISNLISILQKKGLIEVKINKKAGNIRHIYPLLYKNSNIGIPKNEYSYTEKSVNNNSININNIKENIFINKNKEFSDENSETSFSKKEKSNILKKKNQTSSKEKEKSSFEKNNLVEEFNKLPFPREHKDPSTKIYQKAVKYFKYLKTGKFAERCAVDKTFMVKNKLSLDEITHKFTDKEIIDTLNKLLLIFKEGYFPTTKDNLPKDLAPLIYNERTGHSWFFKVYKNPPKPIKQIKADDIKIEVDPEIEKQYRKLLAESGLSEDKAVLKYCLQDITSEAKKIHRRLGDVYAHRSFSSYFGSKKNLRPFYQTHIDFLKTKNAISIDKIKVGSFAWKDFVSYVKNEMDFILCPDDKQLQKLEKEREFYLDRKASAERSAELQRQKEMAENF